MIIRDFTDNDLYKFTAMNAIQKKFPDAEVVYRFVDRSNTRFPEGFATSLQREINRMATLSFSAESEAYMRKKCYYFDHVFFDLLKGYRFDPSEVSIHQQGGTLDVEIRGLWYRTVLWEVPLMAIISELYFTMTVQTVEDPSEKTREKAKAFVEMKAELSKMGTRRRYSFDVQDMVIRILKENMRELLNGTSNVYLAMKYNLTPMGTHPHEWFMYHGAHYGYRAANLQAMEHWVDVYGGDLGIALTDTYTSDDFFLHFSTKQAKLFDGLRWDSGDPFKLTDKALATYRKHRIDPESKTIVYSDSLNTDKIRKIKSYVGGKIHDVYGVGTFLTNDVGVKPLNMVVKLFEVKPPGAIRFLPTVKLSDVPGKNTGDPEEIELCKRVLRLDSSF